MVSFEFLSEPIHIEEDKVSVLCLENQLCYRNVVSAFVNDTTEECNIVFSENYIPFKLKNNICFIDDFFRLGYNSAILKKIYEQIEKFCNIELQKETIDLKVHLVNYFENIVRQYDYDFEFVYDFNFVELFKLIGLKPVCETSDLLGALLEFILIVNRYAPPKCFVLTNLHLYFSYDEIEFFCKDVVNNHINILIIENKKNFTTNEYEKVIIFDDDLCEIVEK